MIRNHMLAVLAICMVCACTAFAEEPAAPSESVTSCNLENGSQIAVRYLPVKAQGDKKEFGGKIPFGTVWTPNDTAMVLFTDGTITAGSKQLGPGAYTMFVIPNKSEWTLVISKETDTKAKYDQTKDMARLPMEIGSLPQSYKQFSVILGHTGPNECSIRIYWQKNGAFSAFTAK